MENGSIESDKLKYTPIRTIRSKASARKELKSSFLDFVCPVSSTPNIDSKSTNKPKYSKARRTRKIQRTVKLIRLEKIQKETKFTPLKWLLNLLLTPKRM